MNVFCEFAQYSWEDDDYAAPIRCETNAAGGRTDITSEEVIERFRGSLGKMDSRMTETVVTASRGQPYVLEDYTFLKAVSEDRPSWLDFGVATYAHQVVDAIYESAKSGNPVEMTAVLPAGA